MRTITCHFQFSDGAVALAALSTPAPEDSVEIQYAGESDRLPDKFDQARACTLKSWAEDAAAATHAKLQITEAGQYDTWAE